MGSIDIIKRLFLAVPSREIGNLGNWECGESNPGLLGTKRECSPLCYAAPQNGLTYIRLQIIRPLRSHKDLRSHFSKSRILTRAWFESPHMENKYGIFREEVVVVGYGFQSLQ